MRLNLHRQLPSPTHDQASGRSQQLTNRGFTFHQTHNFKEALDFYQQALNLDPHNSRAYYLSGLIHLNHHQYDTAFTLFESAHLSQPSSLPPITALLTLSLEICDGALFNQALSLLPDHIPPNHLTGELINLLETHAPDTAKKLHLPDTWHTFVNQETKSLLEYFSTHSASHQSGTRIRLGYLSSQCHHLHLGRQLLTLISAHNRSMFEVYLISTGIDHGTSLERQQQKHTDVFMSKPSPDIATLTSLIRHLGIDILINLDDSLSLAVAGAFALHASPVCLNYPGWLYPQYLPTNNHHLDPIHSNVNWYLTTPHPTNPTPKDHIQAHLPQDKQILISLIPPSAISSSTLALFFDILHRHPRTILLLPAYPKTTRDNLLANAAKSNLSSDKIIFASPTQSWGEFYSLLPLASLYLESPHYNDHHHAVIALQQGLPVITLKGNHLSNQTTALLLESLKLKNCIATNHSQYLDIVSRMLTQADKSQQVKHALRSTNLPFFDVNHTLPPYEEFLQRLWQKK